MKPCFRVTTFRFSGKCQGCGVIAEWHEQGGRFLCAACCPSCRQVTAFDSEPLPVGVTGEQKKLF